MEEEIVKGEEIIATPEETVAEQAPAEETVAEQASVEEKAEEKSAEVKSIAEVLDKVSDAVEDVVESAADAVEDLVEEVREALPVSCSEVIGKLKKLQETAGDIAREELEQLKQIFYRHHNSAMGQAKSKFVEAGNDADAFVPADQCPDLVAEEEEYKATMNVIKEKRAEAQKELERVREENYLRKQAILDRLKTMVESADTESVSYDDFQAIQQEWRDIKDVPPEKAAELWKTYQMYTEKFYDIRKLNNMFREYDFKKNLEIKTRICEQAEKLAEEEDVVVAFRQLQKLHQEFRETGPVAKDLREEIWNRFKEASTLINRRHQEHFEAIKKSENESLEQKIAICEIIEGINYDELTGYAKWNEKTQEVLALQDKWKTLGFAPQKHNQKVFERFRAACDTFFSRKAEFFKSSKENLAANLAKKTALCEQAEALKDSTDWKATSEKLAALQKEWKAIGPVPKKQSEAIWKRFVAACDAFFANRNSANSSQRTEEQKNLSAKKGVIRTLQELSDKVEDGVQDLSEDLSDKLHDLIAEWNGVGHVPFKEKDKVYKQYRGLIDGLFDKLHVSESARRVSNFRKKVSESGNPDRERERLLQAYDRIKNEIKTYENNLGFLTASSKNGSTLLAEMQRKMEKLKADADEILEKIKALDAPLETPAETSTTEEN